MKPKENVLIKNGAKTFECSTITVSYKAKEGFWRGFVLPYDVTYEADSKDKVMNVLKDMVSSYEQGLRKYNNPPHLKNVPILSSPEDNQKWREISVDVVNNFLVNKLKISGSDYYAETKLPA